MCGGIYMKKPRKRLRDANLTAYSHTIFSHTIF